MIYKHFLARFSMPLYLLTLVAPISLNANAGFLSGSSTGDLIIIFIQVVSLLLLILSLIARIFVKSNFFIYLSIFGLLFSYWVALIGGIKDDFTPKVEHSFQEAYTYGAYRGDDKPYYGDGKNILDMHFNDAGPSVLDDNKTIHENIFTEYARTTYIDALEYVEFFSTKGNDLYAFEHKNKRNPFVIYSPNDKKWQPFLKKLTFNLQQTKYYVELFDKNPNKLDFYINNYENIDINDTEAIKKIPSDKIVLLIDRPNKNLIFYKNEKFYKPFPLPYTPKLAIYDQRKDAVYVVYQEKKGIYLLKNTKKEQYEEIQRFVRYIVNQSLLPFWENQNVNSQQITKERLKTLRKALLANNDLWLYYEIDNVQSNMASVIITTHESSDVGIQFILLKDKRWGVKKIIYIDKKQMKILGSGIGRLDEK